MSGADTRKALLVAAAYIATVLVANALTSHFGLVAVGFGLTAAAGTFAAGLALGLRDLLHDAGGVPVVLAVIAVGTGLSFAVGDGKVAVASGVAFLLAELLDLVVYAPLRRHRWRTAVLASNAAGAVVDTVVFLGLAGLPLTVGSVTGQLLVKVVWVTGTFLLVAEVVRRAVPRQRLVAEGA